MVRGDASRGVIKRALIVVDGKGVPAEVVDDLCDDLIASSCEPRSAREPLCPDLRIGKGDERVNRRAPRVGQERPRAQGSRKVRDDALGNGFDGKSDRLDLTVGCCDDDQIDRVNLLPGASGCPPARFFQRHKPVVARQNRRGGGRRFECPPASLRA